MNYSITIVWSFRNRFDVLKKSLQSADAVCPSYINFCLIDASSDEITIRKLRNFCNTIKGRTVRVCESAYRSTLSEAWNLGIMLSNTRYVIFVSSDVEFKNDTWIKELQKMIDAGYEYVLVENHAVFMLDKRSIPKIGWFDERYALGPHFDTDLMIRASENKVRFIIVKNNGSYFHYDSPETTKERKAKDVKDRLPMHDLTNENIFKTKWKTIWAGWQDGIHPPTNITQVKRRLPEIDPHPFYTKKYQDLYEKESVHQKVVTTIKRVSVKFSERLTS